MTTTPAWKPTPTPTPQGPAKRRSGCSLVSLSRAKGRRRPPHLSC
uniref:Uncharacterized protein n=1 Tax=Arundo donax TaxID=35708 RepID=A0A0A9FV01_ARUDO